MRATPPFGGGFFATGFSVGTGATVDGADGADAAAADAAAASSLARLNLPRFGGRRDCFVCFGLAEVKCFKGDEVVCTASNSTTLAAGNAGVGGDFLGGNNVGFVAGAGGAGGADAGAVFGGGGCNLTGM